MTNQATLLAHLQVCAELDQLAHDENRHLKEQQTVPPAALLERKRQLLERLDQNLTSLRADQPESTTGREESQLGEKIRDRILQILQLDKENEQLLLRVSLSRGPAATALPAPSPAMLEKIYARTRL